MNTEVISLMKKIEPGYNQWSDEEINNQIEAIYECGYELEQNSSHSAFKHKVTGFYLSIPSLHFYKPDQIKISYERTWSKMTNDDYDIKVFAKRSLLSLMLLIFGLVIGFIFFHWKTALIINGLILSYHIFYSYKMKKLKQRKKIANI